jgi:hypothetical protein
MSMGSEIKITSKRATELQKNREESGRKTREDGRKEKDKNGGKRKAVKEKTDEKKNREERKE